MNKYRIDALIVGGGIAGLTSGIALRAKGMQIAILEKRPRSANAGTAVVLWPNGVKVLQSLGIDAELAAIATPLLNVEVKSMEGSNLGTTDIARFSEDTKGPVYVVDRNDLKELLLSQLPEDCIHFSSSLQNVNATAKSVRVISSTGSEFSTEILIGADGINSEVRALYFNESKVRGCGVYDWMGITPAIPDFTRRGTGLEFLGPAKRAGFMPLKDGNIYFRFTCALNSPPLEAASRISLLRQMFSNENEVIQRYLRQIHESDVTFVEESEIDPLSEWTKGRICLIGDAAHAMTPALGQGANQSLEDAYVLSKTLASFGISPEGLQQFCISRKKRANDILIKSGEKTKLFIRSRSTLLEQWYDDMKNLSSKNSMKSLFDMVIGGPLG